MTHDNLAEACRKGSAVYVRMEHSTAGDRWVVYDQHGIALYRSGERSAAFFYIVDNGRQYVPLN